MEIKDVNNLDLEDCKRFLNDNQNSELSEAVKFRQKQLMDESSRQNREKDKERKQQIRFYEDKMQWIDINQFNEKKKYKNYSVLPPITITITSIITIIIMSESVNYFGIMIPLMCILSICLCCFFIKYRYPRNSPIISKIYNIQDEPQMYRAIQNKQGKMGLCKVDTLKLKKVLTFSYDNLFMISDNSYICKKAGKVGIYNTEVKKMIVPVIYDDIYSITDDSVDLIKGNQVYRFTHKGYRIVK